MYLIAKPLSLTFVVLFTFLTADAIRAREGDACPSSDINFRESNCTLSENCETLEAYINAKVWTLDEIPSCGFKNAYHSEMICCPIKVYGESQAPASAPASAPAPAPASAPTYNDGLSFKHLASLAYLTPITLDDFVYHCTAIVLSAYKVLATSKCVGRETTEIPSKVLVGVTDPREYFEPDLEFEIKAPTLYNNELALFELHSPITLGHPLMANVSTATLCDENELEGQPKMHAVAFAQNDTNCDLFRTRLVRHDDCSQVRPDRQVAGIQIPKTHLCVAPNPSDSNSGMSDGCTKCLTASTSVLHVHRADGTFCVAGIATPTTNKCIANKSPIYYTIIVTRAAQDFFRGRRDLAPTFRIWNI